MTNNDDNIDDISTLPEEGGGDLDIEAEEANFADKIKVLKKKQKELERERQEYLAGWQRAKADFVNLRQAEERAKGEIAKITKETILLDILPVLDNFEMAFANQESWQAVAENWRQGVEHIYDQLKRTLEDHGLTPIEPLGQVFDPLEHHSIGIIDVTSEKDDNLVREVMRKGYKLGERVIRPAQVKVGIYNQN